MTRSMWRVYTHEKTSAQDRNRVEKELTVSAQRQATLKGRVDVLETPQGVEDEIHATEFGIESGLRSEI